MPQEESLAPSGAQGGYHNVHLFIVCLFVHLAQTLSPRLSLLSHLQTEPKMLRLVNVWVATQPGHLIWEQSHTVDANEFIIQ